MRNTHVVLALATALSASAQIITAEDSLNAGLVRSDNTTLISGYGEAKVSYDEQLGIGTANLTRNVLFLGHRFNQRITFFSEWELEDGRIEGGKAGGEFSLEQLFVKFDLSRDIYLTGGLFIPRIGIINENHLPTTFNGNDRPFVERHIIPSTWREIGVGLYGRSRRFAGLNWSVALQNGLRAGELEHGSGIRGGRGEGSDANASNLALSASILYYWKKFRFQASGYLGGSSGVNRQDADSLKLAHGPFATPVQLVEGNVQYLGEKLRLKALVSHVAVPDAARINDAFGNNTPTSMFGAYAEAGFDLWSLIAPAQKRDLIAFVRYENLDMNAAIPTNGIDDPTLRQQYVIAGITYAPVGGISVKLDHVLRSTGALDPALLDGNATALPYFRENGWWNIGLAYSF